MSIQEKWDRYVKPALNEYSATTQWESAQAQGLELMKQIPVGVKKILDLGCGDGWSVNALCEAGYEAVGVTVNPAEVAHAKARYNLDLYLQDMHDLIFADGSFDCVYCRECYEHSVAPYIALCEINRVLKMHGCVLLHLPNQNWIRENSHFSVFNDAQMREMFYKCFFDITAEGKTDVGFWYLALKTKEI